MSLIQNPLLLSATSARVQILCTPAARPAGKEIQREEKHFLVDCIICKETAELRLAHVRGFWSTELFCSLFAYVVRKIKI